MDWFISIFIGVIFIIIYIMIANAVKRNKKKSKELALFFAFVVYIFLIHSFVADASSVTLAVENQHRVSVTASVEPTFENTQWSSGTLKTSVTVIIP